MRIFETYPQLRAALDLPALEPGAYRFTPAYGVAGFQCAHCGAVRVFPMGGVCTGYGVQHGQMFCYECCTETERERMREHVGPVYAYVSSDENRVTSWSGGTLAQITRYDESRSGWHGSTIARFHAVDTFGNWWQGRGLGAGMSCTLRPMKKPGYAANWGRAAAIDKVRKGASV